MTGVKKITIIAVLLFITLSIFSACSNSMQLVNEITLNLDKIEEIQISYDEENITFYQSDSNHLIVKEYMTANKKSYYAKVKEQDNKIDISEGGRPLLKDHFDRYIELYLPSTYKQNLVLRTTSGNIDVSQFDIDLKALTVESTSGVVELANVAAETAFITTTSGTVKCGHYIGQQFIGITTSGEFDLGQIQAKKIELKSTNGKIVCMALNGMVSYDTTSGDLYVASAIGSGQYVADQSGVLHIIYQEVTKNVSAFNKNDDIILELPLDLSFQFEASSKDGVIHTTFDEYLIENGRSSFGMIGNTPFVTITLETKNGDIQVIQSS